MRNTLRCSLKRHVFSWFVVLAMAVGLFGSVSAAGQTGALGTRGAGFHATVIPGKTSPATDPSSPPIDPSRTYNDASYGTGGIALRNRGTGVLHVSGVSGRVQDAYLYWAILFNTAQPGPALHEARLSRILPPPIFGGGINPDFQSEKMGPPGGYNSSSVVTLEGTLLGIGADPCWGSKGIAVFRAQVPRWIAAGNGAYQVTLASGLTDGSDPWVGNPVFPLAEGASLVIVGSGNYAVGIYDAGFTAVTFGDGNTAGDTMDYSLAFPGPLTTDALWDNIGADGQVAGPNPGQSGGGRVDVPALTEETTTINGKLIAGPGGVDNNSDWNGSAGLPIPQLWDDTGHDILSAVNGQTSAEISFYSPDDCIATVANVLAVK